MNAHALSSWTLSAVIGLMCVAGTAGAAQSRPARIAIFTPGQSLAPVHEGLQDGLMRLGYKEGRDISYFFEETNGSSFNLEPRLPRLLAAKPDVIFAVSTVHALVAKRATTTVPVVFAWVADPVPAGLIAGYADVKRNLTGVAAVGDVIMGKRLEVLLQIAPRIKRLLALVATPEEVAVNAVRSLQKTAAKFGVQVVRRDVAAEEEVTPVLHEVRKGAVDAIFHVPSTVVRAKIELLAQKAMEYRIPLAVHEDTLLERGALVSYGPNPHLIGIQAAALVDRILKGVPPGEIPVENPNGFFLGINRKIAREIGIQIPSDLLERADHLVE